MNKNKDRLAGDDFPLCVDLDGTLVRSDLLIESTLALLGRNPLYLFMLPLWLWRGKAFLKREVAIRVTLDPTRLPYDRRVMHLLQTTGQRPRILCTASDESLARLVASHTGLFDDVLASDGNVNLSGRGKARALVERFGRNGFDYAGNASVDLHVWREARAAIVVNAGDGLVRQAAAVTAVHSHLPREHGVLRAMLKSLRLHQWIKNLLVFVPLMTAHLYFEPEAIGNALLAFLAFGLMASGVYLLNDLLDLGADRRHPTKQHRPLAAGTLPLVAALVAVPILSGAALSIAWLCGPIFTLVLAIYLLLTLLYSFRLKQVPILDTIVLASLYTIRIIGGTVAIGVAFSFWLLAFAMFVFQSLAMLKRSIELRDLQEQGGDRPAGRGYSVADLPIVLSLGTASGYIAVMVLALYIHSPESLELYRRPEVLWLLCPIVMYWISHMWLVAYRGRMHADPVVFAARDRISQAVVVLCGAVMLGAT